MPVQGKAHVRPPRSRKKPSRGKDRVSGSRIKDPVPVAPLRDYFLRGLERGDFTVCSVAEELGWYRGQIKGRQKQGVDSTRVQRMLGLRGYSPGRHKNGKVYGSEPRTLLNYDTAVLLCRAMGMDPCDVRYENGDPAL